MRVPRDGLKIIPGLLLKNYPEVYLKAVFLDVPGMFLKINLKMHVLDFMSSTPLARHDYFPRQAQERLPCTYRAH